MPRCFEPALILALILTACGGTEQGTNAVPGGRRVADLIAAGSCPVQVSAGMKAPDGIAGSFIVKIINRSDSPVGDIKWGIVLRDSSGNAMLDGVLEGGYNDEVIGPSETADCPFTIPHNDPGDIQVIIKSLLWYTPNPLGGDEPPLPHVWRNPLYDLQLHAAMGLPGEE